MITLSINRSNASTNSPATGLAQGFVRSAAAAKRTLTPMPQLPVVQLPAAPKAPVNPNAPLLLRVFQWFNAKRVARPAKQLAVAETVSLGEKRFVSVVTVGNRQFLVGGGPGNVQLLAELGATENVSEAVKKASNKTKTAEPSFAKTLKKTSAPKVLAAKSRKASLPAPASASHKVLPAVAAKVLPAPSAYRCMTSNASDRAAQAASRKRKAAQVFVAGGLA